MAPNKKPNGVTMPKKLSPEMAEFMGKPKASAGEIISKVWKHIKKKDLQDPKQRRYINPDETLEAIFGPDQFSMFRLSKKVFEHFV